MYSRKLYIDNGERRIPTVNYPSLSDNAVKVSGGLTPDGYGQISDDGNYVIELEDRHRIRCNLIRNVNRMAIGFAA